MDSQGIVNTTLKTDAKEAIIESINNIYKTIEVAYLKAAIRRAANIIIILRIDSLIEPQKFVQNIETSLMKMSFVTALVL